MAYRSAEGEASGLPWAGRGMPLPWNGCPQKEREWQRRFFIAAGDVDDRARKAFARFEALSPIDQRAVWDRAVGPWFAYLNRGTPGPGIERHLSLAEPTLDIITSGVGRRIMRAVGGRDGLHAYLDLVADAFLAWRHVNRNPDAVSRGLPVQFVDERGAPVDLRARLRQRVGWIIEKSGLLDAVAERAARRRGLSLRVHQDIRLDLRQDIALAALEGLEEVPPPRKTRSSGLQKNLAWALRDFGNAWIRPRYREGDAMPQGEGAAASANGPPEPAILLPGADEAIDCGKAVLVTANAARARLSTAKMGEGARRAHDALLMEYEAGTLTVEDAPDATRLARSAGVSKATVSRAWAELRGWLREAQDAYVQEQSEKL